MLLFPQYQFTQKLKVGFRDYKFFKLHWRSLKLITDGGYDLMKLVNSFL